MGIDVANRLIAGGAPGLHLYAINQHETVLSILDGCGLLPNQGTTTEKEPA